MLTNGRIVMTYADGRVIGKDFDSLQFVMQSAVITKDADANKNELAGVREIRILLRGEE